MASPQPETNVSYARAASPADVPTLPDLPDLPTLPDLPALRIVPSPRPPRLLRPHAPLPRPDGRGDDRRYRVCQFCSQVVNVSAPFCFLGVEPLTGSHGWCADCQAEAAQGGRVVGYRRLYLAAFARWADRRRAGQIAQHRFTQYVGALGLRRLDRATRAKAVH